MPTKYKNSCSKTNDEYEEVYEDKGAKGRRTEAKGRGTEEKGKGRETGKEQGKGKGKGKETREEKMREIDNYLLVRSKERNPERRKEESAKPKRDRTANLVFSEEQLGQPEDVELMIDYGE